MPKRSWGTCASAGDVQQESMLRCCHLGTQARPVRYGLGLYSSQSVPPTILLPPPPPLPRNFLFSVYCGADVQHAVEGVASAAQGIWPQASAVLFGSQATGLALPGSDLDIVVLNVGPHIQRAGTGFSQAQVGGEKCGQLQRTAAMDAGWAGCWVGCLPASAGGPVLEQTKEADPECSKQQSLSFVVLQCKALEELLVHSEKIELLCCSHSRTPEGII
jgi:hypothetical protein